ncbi:MAG: DUF6783 domain-containing protein [Lacrimispora saccharolytica]
MTDSFLRARACFNITFYKFPSKWGVQIAGMNFQTHFSIQCIKLYNLYVPPDKLFFVKREQTMQKAIF